MHPTSKFILSSPKTEQGCSVSTRAANGIYLAGDREITSTARPNVGYEKVGYGETEDARRKRITSQTADVQTLQYHNAADCGQAEQDECHEDRICAIDIGNSLRISRI